MMAMPWSPMVPETMTASPGLDAMRADLNARAQNADAGGVDVAAVAVAALDDFGVAGDDLDAGCCGGLGHRVDDGGELSEQEILLRE